MTFSDSLSSDSFIAPLISEHHKQLETVRRLLTPLIDARRQEIVEKGEHTTDQIEGVSNCLCRSLRFLINLE